LNLLTTLNPELQRNLKILFVAGLLFWSSLASLLPTLPLYVRDVGGSEQQIGLVMGAFAVGLLASRAWLGRLADRRSRKIVLLIGLLAAAIAPLCYVFVQSIPLLILIRIFHGISIAAFTTGYSALVVDLSPPQNRGELIGYMSLVNPIGVALGPTLGGFLQAWAGYTPLFLLSAGLAAVGFLCTGWVQDPTAKPPGTKPGMAAGSNPSQQQFWQMLKAPRLRVPTLVLLLIGLTFGTVATFVPLYIAQEQVPLNAGLFYTAAAIASFSVRILTGRASDRVGRGLFISISLGFYLLAMLTLWSASSAALFLIAGFVEGLGAGILIPMMAALMADRSGADERGRIFSLCMGGFDLGIAIAGPILGSIAGQVGLRTMFGFAGAFALSALLIFLTRSSKDLPHSLRFALGRGRDVYALKS
jgi:MFS family permease